MMPPDRELALFFLREVDSLWSEASPFPFSIEITRDGFLIDTIAQKASPTLSALFPRLASYLDMEKGEWLESEGLWRKFRSKLQTRLSVSLSPAELDEISPIGLDSQADETDFLNR